MTTPDASASSRWYAVRTRPRQEERAAANLSGWNVEAFCPFMAHKLARGPEPLFPGYIFARFSYEAMLRKICFTRGVASVVSFGGVPSPVEDGIIALIRSRIEHGNVVRIAPEFNPGDRVRITSGALANFVGIFERDLPESERVRILLTSVTYNARIEVERFRLARLSSNAS